MNPNKRLVALVIVLAIVVIGAIVSWSVDWSGSDNPELREVMEKGSLIHVACARGECGHEQDDYRAHSYDMDWPKACPACGQKSLYRAKQCPGCAKYTPWQADPQGRVYCRYCQRWLNPTPGSDDAPNTGSPAGP